MASPAVVYFAGVATVVAALGAGFGGALVLTNPNAAHKEPAAAFAKRSQPVEEAQAVTTATQETAPLAPGAASDLIPATPTTPEAVVALQFAPPQPQAPPATPQGQSLGSIVSAPVAASVAAPAPPDAPKTIAADPKVKKDGPRNPVATAERKKEPTRKQYAERKKRQIAPDDEIALRATAYVEDRQPERRGGDFFSILFGN